jgi:biofilm PGA synthesis lipoprotein PgaB
MRGAIAILLLLLLAGPQANAEAPGARFVAIAFHDVVDRREDRAEDAVTTQSLVSFLDFLVAEGWTAVSLAEVAAAGQGGPALPEKSVLLTFDDGYRSFYERVYPLLLAYRMPAVLALVTSWMDVPEDGVVDYGGTPIPRSGFVSWNEVRQMQSSGLIEIASHSHDLHRVVLMNREGNTAPAARTWTFDPTTGGVESDAAHRARIEADLARSRARILAETGQPPRAIVWPFGRFSGPALEAAQAAGFQMALTLEPEAADARQPLAIHRYYPTSDPDLGTIMFNLRFAAPRAETVRMACLDPAPLAEAIDEPARDALLGRLIEDVRELGATAVILPLLTGGTTPRAWLPTEAAPMEAHLFGRLARQLSTRAGVEVFASLDRSGLLALGEARAATLLADAARAAPIDGIVLPAEGARDPPPPVPPSRADLRAARATSGADPARLFAAAARIDPRLRLILSGPATPHAGADRALLPAPQPELARLGWRNPDHAGRMVETLPLASPRTSRRSIRDLQRQGATALALCPWNPGETVHTAPAFSAATTPWRP